MARPYPNELSLINAHVALQGFTGVSPVVPGEYANLIRIQDTVAELTKLYAKKRHSRARAQARELFALIAQYAIDAYLESHTNASTTKASSGVHDHVSAVPHGLPDGSSTTHG